MKKLYTILILAASALHIIAWGQPSITFTFTGLNDSSFFQLDSIKVRNLSRDCDTVLYYPDTVLTIYIVGMNESNYPADGFRVLQNYPNPSTGATYVSLYVPSQGHVNMSVADAAGHRILSSDQLLDQGFHSFLLTLPGEGLYLFRAGWNNISSAIRIVSMGKARNGSCSLYHSGVTQADIPLKSTPAISDFLFNPGDELMLAGFGAGLESGFVDHPETSRDYVFQFATNIPCPGLDSIYYSGQWYHTVQIFSQCWIVENLNAGTMIPSTQNQSNNNIIEKYCMGDVEYYCSLLGGLYFWDEMMNYTFLTSGQGICPEGFHIPSDNEWQILEGAADSAYGIGASVWDANGWRGTDAGGNLKQTGYDFWEYPNTGATDAFGFSARAGGYFVQNSFWGPGYKAYFWSSDVDGKYYRNLDWDKAAIQRNTGGNGGGFSVRCIRD